MTPETYSDPDIRKSAAKRPLPTRLADRRRGADEDPDDPFVPETETTNLPDPNPDENRNQEDKAEKDPARDKEKPKHKHPKAKEKR